METASQQNITSSISGESSVTAGSGVSSSKINSANSLPSSYADKAKSAASKDITPREPAEISLRSLLEAGVHFGHQTSRWNPAMSKFIYGVRNGIHVIHLPRTIESWAKAREAIVEVAARGGSILFVGTKKQAQDAVVEEARRCGAYYVSRRWLGGMMTNFQTIRKSIDRMAKIDQILAEEEASQKMGKATKFKKKERLMMTREREKLEFSLGGIREMYGAPSLMFVIDTKREDIAIKEATKLDIPVVAMVDTNCDPDLVQYPVPANDDGTRSIRLFCQAVADAVLEGKSAYSKRLGRDGDLQQKKKADTPAAATGSVSGKETESPSPVADGSAVNASGAETEAK
ncbi:MAG TPA: 30S ribosomal protein S2 [Oligoflexia bacterium]|nr:30S ribosomal protein S2 [Oligoflexia bacterium]HMP47264.1 30S ribosomal protein S2 [Oligoflexia bacterium]